MAIIPIQSGGGGGGRAYAPPMPGQRRNLAFEAMLDDKQNNDAALMMALLSFIAQQQGADKDLAFKREALAAEKQEQANNFAILSRQLGAQETTAGANAALQNANAQATLFSLEELRRLAAEGKEARALDIVRQKGARAVEEVAEERALTVDNLEEVLVGEYRKGFADVASENADILGQWATLDPANASFYDRNRLYESLPGEAPGTKGEKMPIFLKEILGTKNPELVARIRTSIESARTPAEKTGRATAWHQHLQKLLARIEAIDPEPSPWDFMGVNPISHEDRPILLPRIKQLQKEISSIAGPGGVDPDFETLTAPQRVTEAKQKTLKMKREANRPYQEQADLIRGGGPTTRPATQPTSQPTTQPTAPRSAPAVRPGLDAERQPGPASTPVGRSLLDALEERYGLPAKSRPTSQPATQATTRPTSQPTTQPTAPRPTLDAVRQPGGSLLEEQYYHPGDPFFDLDQGRYDPWEEALRELGFAPAMYG